MKSTALVLTEPYEFIAESRDVPTPAGWVLVRPLMVSICAADMRYYTGFRRTDALKSKLPVVLTHEGIGEVLSLAGGFEKGERVVIVPAIPGYIHSPDTFPSREACCSACADESIGENHCSNIRFLSSGADGLLQHAMSHPPECLARVPDCVPDDVAVMSELLTVAYNAVKALKPGKYEQVALFGDGPVAYITALVLRHFVDIPQDRIHVYGISPEKLEHFDLATTHDLKVDPPEQNHFRYAFECVGGISSGEVVESAMAALDIGGTLLLVGVNELETPVDTRQVLEKRLTITGVSRSPRQDYPTVLKQLERPDVRSAVAAVICPDVQEVSGVPSLKKAFDLAASKKHWGKLLLRLAFS